MSDQVRAPEIPEFTESLEGELRRRASRRGRARRARLVAAPVACALLIGLGSWAALRGDDPRVRIQLGDEPGSPVTGAPRAEDLPRDLPPRIAQMITDGLLLPFDTKTLTRRLTHSVSGRPAFELWTAEADNNLGTIGLLEADGAVSAGLISPYALDAGRLDECVRDPGAQMLALCGRVVNGSMDLAWGATGPGIRTVTMTLSGRRRARAFAQDGFFVALAPRGRRLLNLSAPGISRPVTVPGDGRSAPAQAVSRVGPRLALPRRLAVTSVEGTATLYARTSRGGAYAQVAAPGSGLDTSGGLGCGQEPVCTGSTGLSPGSWPIYYYGRVPAGATKAELVMGRGARVPMALRQRFVLAAVSSASARVERVVVSGPDGREIASSEAFDPRPRRLLRPEDIPLSLPSGLRSALLQPSTDSSGVDLDSFREVLGVETPGGRIAIWTAKMRQRPDHAVALLTRHGPTNLAVPPNTESLVGCEPPGVSPVEMCPFFGPALGPIGGIIGPDVARVLSTDGSTGEVTEAVVANGYFLVPFTNPTDHSQAVLTALDDDGSELARLVPFGQFTRPERRPTLSEGLVVVPDVGDVEVSRAREMMRAVGLEVSAVGVAGAPPDGQVFSQALPPWSGAVRGSTIRLQVGPAQVVPKPIPPDIALLDTSPTTSTGQRRRIVENEVGGRYLVAEDAARRVCLARLARPRWSTCRRRGILTREPVIRRIDRDSGAGRATLSILAVDGFDTVVASDGTRGKAVDNVLVMQVSSETTGFVISGPAGRKRIALPRGRSAPPQRP